MTSPASSTPTAGRDSLSKRALLVALVVAGVLVVSASRIISDNGNLTSAGTFGVMVRTAAPIALAGLAGLFAERSGTVNIGLEGMMIMGTIFAGWWGWEWGPWMAILGGVIGGILGGLLHAVATVTFGVNHIVSGFAINIIAPGVARFMAGLLFIDEAGSGIEGGSISNSPGLSSSIGRFTLPLLSGGDLFGWQTPDPLGWLEERQWFAVSDVAGLLKGLT
ncbi:MAG: ABC transporter permease, partial [Actinomycetota bacterium]|nr:ABC transporter permease [Actinomycetota bacterium]